jgi:hypothetical protein
VGAEDTPLRLSFVTPARVARGAASLDGMGRAGDAPVVDVGPVERPLLDPQSLMEAKVTAQLRLCTTPIDVRRIVESQRAAGDVAAFRARVADLATQAVFASLAATARQTSCSVLDVIGPSLRREVEADLTKRLRESLAALGLGVAAIEGLSLTMDPSTETWLRSQRSSPRLTPASARPPSQPSEEATAIAGTCAKCGAQVAADAEACPSCGGAIKPPPPCVFCGSELRPGSRFCVRCGARAFVVRAPGQR